MDAYMVILFRTRDLKRSDELNCPERQETKSDDVLTTVKQASDHRPVRYEKNPLNFTTACTMSENWGRLESAWAAASATLSRTTSAAACVARTTVSPSEPVAGAEPQMCVAISWSPAILANCFGTIENANVSAFERPRRGKERSSRGEVDNRDVAVIGGDVFKDCADDVAVGTAAVASESIDIIEKLNIHSETGRFSAWLSRRFGQE